MSERLRKRLGYTEHVDKRTPLRFIAAEHSVVLAVTVLAIHQICRITFSRRDGSIFVQTPYYRRTSGVVAKFEDPAGIRGTRQYNFIENGKVTSHLVKFSHHPDGSVHFSQTGKIRTEIKRQSFPLDQIGPVFELHAFFLGGFDMIEWAKSRRAYIPFVFRDGIPFGIQVTGQWRRKRDIIANFQPAGGTAGPVSQFMHRRTGQKGIAYFLGQPEGFRLREQVLVLEAAPLRPPAGLDRETLILMGGWDPTEIQEAEADRLQTGFLAAMYPVDSPEELASRIGTVDLP